MLVGIMPWLELSLGLWSSGVARGELSSMTPSPGPSLRVASDRSDHRTSRRAPFKLLVEAPE